MAVPPPGVALRATYRVQLHAGFTFDDAAAVVPYLARLGFSHLYTSPMLQAAPGSTHGYDVVDHGHINEELGGAAGYERLQGALRAHGMGHVLDIVPNHMAIAGRANAWWWDVLENGPSSLHAVAFDIDWAGGDTRSVSRVLVPVLGDQIGRVLEAGELSIVRDGGSFTVRYFGSELPISPRSLDELLTAAAQAAGSDELGSIATAFGHLPHALNTDPAAVAERHRDKELLRERLAALAEADDAVAAAIDAQLQVISADPDALDALLLRQNFRLAWWRTGREELDYRRFFNIETLVGLRVEDPDVFAASHAVVAALVKQGDVDELRVDHIDGLRDPAQYLERLRDLTGGVPVVVEKILEGPEQLPAEWPVAGTTGYEFAHHVDGLFVDADAEAAMTAAYEEFVGDDRPYQELVRDAKQQIMRDELRAEIERITGMLAAVCQHHRRHRDHTRHELREAVRAVLAAFGVYRTYVRAGHPTSSTDRHYIADATRCAAITHPELDAELLTFLTDLLAGDIDGDDELELAIRFQQVSAPVMAKGVEDTVFYRYHRLISLNEVGGDPSVYGTSPEAFHETNQTAADHHPHAMLTLSTHDTKRSSDVRARIHLLSEIPEQWAATVRHWHELTAGHRQPRRPRSVDRAAALPDARRRVAHHARAPHRLCREGHERGEGVHHLDRPAAGLRRGGARLHRRFARRRGHGGGGRGVPARPPHRRARPRQRAGPDRTAAHLPGRARRVPGHRKLGSQPGRSRQPSTGRLRPPAPPPGRGRFDRRCAGASRRRRPEAVAHRARAGRPPAPPGRLRRRSSTPPCRRAGPRPVMWWPSAAATPLSWCRDS